MQIRNVLGRSGLILESTSDVLWILGFSNLDRPASQINKM